MPIIWMNSDQYKFFNAYTTGKTNLSTSFFEDNIHIMWEWRKYDVNLSYYYDIPWECIKTINVNDIEDWLDINIEYSVLACSIVKVEKKTVSKDVQVKPWFKFPKTVTVTESKEENIGYVRFFFKSEEEQVLFATTWGGVPST